MFCNHCHKDLSEFDSIINKMQNCPLCGGQLEKKLPEVAQKDIYALCDELMKKDGDKIFAKDELFELELKKTTAPEFANARDMLLTLTIKHIPSTMYMVKKFSEGEKREALGKCSKRLCIDLGMTFESCTKMLDMLQERIWQKKYPLSPNFADGVFQDPRDGQVYKTVRIGNQVWMKENLRYKCPGLCENNLYNGNALQYAAVTGWRLPTRADFDKLIDSAKESGYGDPSSVLMSRSGGWEKFTVTPTDNLGFDAKPFKDCSYVHYWMKNETVFEISLGKVTYGNAVKSYIRLIKDTRTAETPNLILGKKTRGR